ncbi:MAG: MBL fold metallo-hydrolase [Thermoanaerobaculia bacterium]|nr:MBL fold metallo-hydrolase [Thermoanaerobaculia bacterium]
MKVKFWGTRGSIPTPLDAGDVRGKVRRALEKAIEANLDSREAIESFIDGELGTAEAATWGGDTSCVEIEAGEGTRILCDAGTGLRSFGNAILDSSASDERLTYHLLMSHFHWDHVMGLPFFTPAYVPGNRIVIHSCHDVAEEAIRSLWGLPGFPVRFEDLGAEFIFENHQEGEVFEVDDLRVSAIRQRHAGDSFGYRLEGRGRKIVYSTDSEHKKDLIRRDYPFLGFIRGVDLLIFDAQYSLEEAVSVKEDWGHSSNVIGVDLAHRAGVRTLCLFHHEPNYDDDRLQQILDEAIEYAKEFEGYVENKVEIISAWDGLELDV